MNMDKIMKDKGITNVMLAKEFNTSTATISRWRNGINNPDVKIIPAICDFIGCSLEEMLRENPTRPLPEQKQRAGQGA